MMKCPRCGGDTAVKDSRPVVHFGRSSIRRRRYCTSTECEMRFQTVELMVGLGNVSDALKNLTVAASRCQVAIEAFKKAVGEANLGDPLDDFTTGEKKEQ